MAWRVNERVDRYISGKLVERRYKMHHCLDGLI
jgi:hypothetical protein